MMCRCDGRYNAEGFSLQVGCLRWGLYWGSLVTWLLTYMIRGGLVAA
jgi:hypothetical protein